MVSLIETTVSKHLLTLRFAPPLMPEKNYQLESSGLYGLTSHSCDLAIGFARLALSYFFICAFPSQDRCSC
jgi:hypothetical protein